MPRGANRGVNAQKVASLLARKLSAIAGIESVDSGCQGAEGGREFTFMVNSLDGGVILVSAYQVELPPSQLSNSPPRTQAKNVADQRQQRWLDAQERRRKRWLGEL